ncbi:MMPL family transporter [Gordonia sp. X0973]|uniref:MMPL family transporter n=1 Tax=Gordonia sp. X0973 TaxID=2742602 RepID=UPI000F545429|nr:MMPL family transporter [Gordonia sp. X0973]QKT08894.1 MMPL family transporter [Gordonia sp. X0973]
MFGWIGTFAYRMRYTVIAVMVALMAGLGLYGLDLSKHLSQSGWFDPTSQSAKGSVLADNSFGRDHKSDIVLLITPPDGTKVDDPAFGAKVEKFVTQLTTDPETKDLVGRDTRAASGDDPGSPGIIDPFVQLPENPSPAALLARATVREHTFNEDKTKAFISIGVQGNDDTSILTNYKKLRPAFDNIDTKFGLEGTKFELAGLQPIANSMAIGMEHDIKRAEVIALPVVALMLFFVFGGVVAAALPVFIGGLTIAGSLGIMKLLTHVTEVNVFAQSVVTLIGLGIAIDYGLFIVSRFREELAEGYTTKAAVRRTVMTAGQTVWFSATIIIAAIACLLIFPQAFLKSVAYGAIASVALAAFLSITVLPAILGILGPRIDAFGFSFLRKTKTKQEVEDGFWGKLSGWVMKHPLKTAIPTVLLLLALIIPFGNIEFGGISEKYLPPDNPTRQSQEAFDQAFPKERTEAVKIVVVYQVDSDEDQNRLVALQQAANAHDAAAAPGKQFFSKPFSFEETDGGLSGEYPGRSDIGVVQMSAGFSDWLKDPKNKEGPRLQTEAIRYLQNLDKQGLRVYIAGTPALTQDSIDALLTRLPFMTVMLVLITGLLMFLAFGSVILPIKAALVSALGLGATLGILTWIFVDGNGATLLNFTPGPLFAAVLVLIIAIVFGLSTDYEIFLLSRMVEARQKGASTTEAIRVGTAHTGRIITAAAAILVVVTGAFALSDIVMMKYIAFGMIAALILDATIIRMLLVPSTMKLLGDDCWWAPQWMKTVQRKLGLGETILEVEPDEMVDADVAASKSMSAGAVIATAPTSAFRRPGSRRRTSAPTADEQEAPTVAVQTPAAPLPEAPLPEAPAPAPASVPQRPAGPQYQPPIRRTASSVNPPAPAAPVAPTAPVTPTSLVVPAAPRPVPAETDDAPDTGAWRLGKGGIRFEAGGSSASGPTPAVRPSQPPVAPSSTAAPNSDDDGKRAAGNRDEEISVQDLMRRARGQDPQG